MYRLDILSPSGPPGGDRYSDFSCLWWPRELRNTSRAHCETFHYLGLSDVVFGVDAVWIWGQKVTEVPCLFFPSTEGTNRQHDLWVLRLILINWLRQQSSELSTVNSLLCLPLHTTNRSHYKQPTYWTRASFLPPFWGQKRECPLFYLHIFSRVWRSYN